MNLIELSADSEVKLLIPDNDVINPEVTICVPALNESLTIGTFLTWCHEGLMKAGVAGEILIIDSSTDQTAEIAVNRGARVLKTPKRGLGRAYIDALPYIRGQYIILGDCDCTYDFRELRPFIECFRAGYEFVMGSRFLGTIEPGAMPPLHRYLGTPVTTWILNLIYSSHFSDIHCGMRGLTKAAFLKMGLRSQSWEYASEMVLKAVHMELRITEVPIHFLKDQEGRVSHHKREGWFSPWKAAWINLKVMFVFGSDFFLYKPGICFFLMGTALVMLLSLGPIQIGKITFSLYWMLLGLVFAVIGLQSFYMGVIASIFFDYSGKHTKRWLNIFPYSRTILTSIGIGIAGTLSLIPLICKYIEQNYRIPVIDFVSHFAIFGLFLLIISFMTFAFTLLLHGTQVSFLGNPNK